MGPSGILLERAKKESKKRLKDPRYYCLKHNQMSEKFLHIASHLDTFTHSTGVNNRIALLYFLIKGWLLMIMKVDQWGKLIHNTTHVFTTAFCFRYRYMRKLSKRLDDRARKLVLVDKSETKGGNELARTRACLVKRAWWSWMYSRGSPVW